MHSLYLYVARHLPHLCQPGQANVNVQNAAAPLFECSHSLQQGVVGYAHCGPGAREHLCWVTTVPLGYVLYVCETVKVVK